MEIIVNGQPRDVAERASVATLLGELALRGRLAVEVNGDIVPRSKYAETPLKARDTVEIVKAIGGG
jgi:sulfur carrier protein